VAIDASKGRYAFATGSQSSALRSRMQVARDTVTKKSMAVAPLAPETAAQRAQQQAGAARQEARVAAGKADQTPGSSGSSTCVFASRMCLCHRLSSHVPPLCCHRTEQCKSKHCHLVGGTIWQQLTVCYGCSVQWGYAGAHIIAAHALAGQEHARHHLRRCAALLNIILTESPSKCLHSATHLGSAFFLTRRLG